MRKVSTLARAPQYPRDANRYIGRAIRSDGGAGWAVLLSILFWLIFYQNLPGSLDGMASKGPVSTANALDRIIKVCTLAMSVYVIAPRWSLTRSLAKNINAGAVAFMVLAPLSAVWSIEPAATMLRFISLASIILVCFAIS